MKKLLRRKAVLEKLGIQRTALRDAVRKGIFPQPIKLLGENGLLVWDEAEIDAFLARKFDARENAGRKRK
jgi:predicted DNA-binding transcriptional regulator AlpA